MLILVISCHVTMRFIIIIVGLGLSGDFTRKEWWDIWVHDVARSRAHTKDKKMKLYFMGAHTCPLERQLFVCMYLCWWPKVGLTYVQGAEAVLASTRFKLVTRSIGIDVKWWTRVGHGESEKVVLESLECQRLRKYMIAYSVRFSAHGNVQVTESRRRRSVVAEGHVEDYLKGWDNCEVDSRWLKGDGEFLQVI
jgi:hypothetical protein